MLQFKCNEWIQYRLFLLISSNLSQISWTNVTQLHRSHFSFSFNMIDWKRRADLTSIVRKFTMHNLFWKRKKVEERMYYVISHNNGRWKRRETVWSCVLCIPCIVRVLFSMSHLTLLQLACIRSVIFLLSIKCICAWTIYSSLVFVKVS